MRHTHVWRLRAGRFSGAAFSCCRLLTCPPTPCRQSPNPTSCPIPCRSGSPGSCLLTPPDAVGDASAELTPAQLANQALLAARKAIVRWVGGWVGMCMCAWVGMCMCACLLLADALAHPLCCQKGKKAKKAPQTAPLDCCSLLLVALRHIITSAPRLLYIHVYQTKTTTGTTTGSWSVTTRWQRGQQSAVRCGTWCWPLPRQTHPQERCRQQQRPARAGVPAACC